MRYSQTVLQLLSFRDFQMSVITYFFGTEIFWNGDFFLLFSFRSAFLALAPGRGPAISSPACISSGMDRMSE